MARRWRLVARRSLRRPGLPAARRFPRNSAIPPPQLPGVGLPADAPGTAGRAGGIPGGSRHSAAPQQRDAHQHRAGADGAGTGDGARRAAGRRRRRQTEKEGRPKAAAARSAPRSPAGLRSTRTRRKRATRFRFEAGPFKSRKLLQRSTMEDFYRIKRLPPYVFETVNRAKAVARNAGADIVDLGMGNPDLPAPAHVIEKMKETLGKPRTDRYSVVEGHSRPAPRAGRLLRAPLRREAQSRHPGRRHARLQGRLRQRRAGDHRAGRRRAGARSELSDPRLRLPDGRRRHPLGAVGSDAGVLRDPRARHHPLDPEADRGGGLLSVESDRARGRSRFLQGARAVREEARHLHPVRPRLCRGLFRRQPAAVGAAGQRRDGYLRRVHLDVEDLFDARLAHGLCGRQRAHHLGAEPGEVLSRLRRVHADPGRGDRGAQRPRRLHPRDARDLQAPPRRAGRELRPRRLAGAAAGGLDVRLVADPRAVQDARQRRILQAPGREGRGRGVAGHRLRRARRGLCAHRACGERAAHPAGRAQHPPVS